MKENPTLEILIGGHVCCFNDMRLSVLRAKTIYDYLVENGIDKSRMKYKGYGLSKPLYLDNNFENVTSTMNNKKVTTIYGSLFIIDTKNLFFYFFHIF
jgi:hypothetical protein